MDLVIRSFVGVFSNLCVLEFGFCIWLLFEVVKLAALEHNEMSRRCSHCGLNGHNSRTCPDRGVRLFGVRLTDGVSSMNMRKSVSMNNLSHYASAHNPPSPPEPSESGAAPDGYVSDGLVQTSNNPRERKKGTNPTLLPTQQEERKTKKHRTITNSQVYLVFPFPRNEK